MSHARTKFCTLKYDFDKVFLSVKQKDVEGALRFCLDGPHARYEAGLLKDTVPAWKEKNDASISVAPVH